MNILTIKQTIQSFLHIKSHRYATKRTVMCSRGNGYQLITIRWCSVCKHVQVFDFDAVWVASQDVVDLAMQRQLRERKMTPKAENCDSWTDLDDTTPREIRDALAKCQVQIDWVKCKIIRPIE